MKRKHHHVRLQGVVIRRKKAPNPYEAEFMNKTNARTLAEALKGADVFVGLSVAGAVTQDMIKS